MGNYNPRAPRIIGQEWVPIRDEDLVYKPAANSIEIGTSYVQLTSQRPREAHFYAHDLPGQAIFLQCPMVNIYPTGQEDETGPINEVIIPCNSVTITGSNILFTGTSLTESVLSPGDGKYINFRYIGSLQSASFYFAVNQYPVLANKRILNVSLLYSGWIEDQFFNASGASQPRDFINPTPYLFVTLVRQQDDFQRLQDFTPGVSPALMNAGTLEQLGTTVNNPTGSAQGDARVAALNLGDINNFWDSSTAPGNTSKRFPWRYVDLQKFEASAANRQQIALLVQLPNTNSSVPNNPNLYLDYMALRVTYCEEKRVAYGARLFNYRFGTNIIELRDPLFNTDPVLPAGTYLPTLSLVNPGSIGFGQEVAGDFPKLNALRELYALPSHPNTQINVPFPLHDHLGEVFTTETTHVLPQLTLHTSGGVMLEPQVYGRQAIAQVWGSNTASQEIQDGLAGGSANWPWVRYVGRRFGDTTVSLTLTAVGQTATISPSEWDALPEIIDGWKEITLRFSTPPVMGTGTQPTVVWSAAGEAAGNRWEILGASAPAVSGVPGSYFNLGNQQLYSATYGQPISGGIINLNWMPQGVASPWVTGASDDNASDAFVIFAQDMPTVTGFSVVVAAQPVSGIGYGCQGAVPCCIPSAILYNQITWSATSSAIPPSGFGYYEMQRMDTVTTDWQTIMKSTSPTGGSFKDFEARIGVQSSYRIRAVDYYLFPGPWSSTISITQPAPGVSGQCFGDGHLLVFTTNERQSGSSNLAHSEAWLAGERVSEDFTFPEAGFVQLQAMYNRDFFVAFRPEERGGERFTRTLLVQAAAIAPETLADFTSLRNMAWDTVSYICVRDEDGNRWFATVLVPSGRVLRDRRLYLAPVDIIEVTASPSPANPYA